MAKSASRAIAVLGTRKSFLLEEWMDEIERDRYVNQSFDHYDRQAGFLPLDAFDCPVSDDSWGDHSDRKFDDDYWHYRRAAIIHHEVNSFHESHNDSLIRSYLYDPYDAFGDTWMAYERDEEIDGDDDNDVSNLKNLICLNRLPRTERSTILRAHF